jgi:hypothetical protein
MTIRVQELMIEYYSKLGPGPYYTKLFYYDNAAVAAALRYVADRLYTDWGELQHPASVIHEIANELEDDEL